MKIGTLLRITDLQETDSKFAVLRENGFESCQLIYKPPIYEQEAAEAIRSAADKHGIEISAQFCGYADSETVWDNYYGFCTAGLNVEAYRSERLKYVSQAAQFANWLGLTDIVIHAGYVPNNPFAPEYGIMKAAVALLAQRCQMLGLNILFETGGESPVTLLRLIQEVGTGNLYINLDPANILMYGYGNPVDALHTFGEYVRDVHGKDGMPPTDPYKLGVETPLGEGMVDFPKLLQQLHRLGYDRFITIEREISGPQQTQDILNAKQYLNSILSEIH